MKPSCIGTAGWSIPRQHTSAFSGTGSHLERYSRVFYCAEINSSFYRSPRLSTWVKWAESVSEDFRFSVKAPRAITHEAKLRCTPEHLSSFLNEAKTLGARLGPILFQLPPKLAFSEGLAKNFFTMFRDLYSGPAALEPRHPDWFADEPNHLLKEFRIARVAADPGITPASSTTGGYTHLAYYRLHGSPRIYYSAYGETYLTHLAASIRKHFKNTEVWCIFDNTASGAAIGDAQTLQRLLSAAHPATDAI